MPPIAYSFNANNTTLEDISDTAFGEKDVQSIGVTWALTATSVGVEDIRYKLKQIIFSWRNHVFVIEESAITPDDADVIFFDMPELNIFGDESPSEGDEIYMFLCTGSGVTVVPPSVSGLFSSL